MTDAMKPKPPKKRQRAKRECTPPPPEPAAAVTVAEFAGIDVVDLRHLQTDPSLKSKVRRGKTVRSDPKTITAVTLHQTACNFGVGRNHLKAAGGDEELAQQIRALGVACHVLAFREGWVVWSNDLERYLYHANGLSGTSLCLEIEGHYSGLMDDPKTTAVREDVRTTWKGKPDPVTDLTVETARRGLKLLVDEGRALGMPIELLRAHRQSAATRRSDPGEEMWQRVGLDYGVAVLGLQVDNDFTLGGGRPIPKQWDARSAHPY